MLSVFISGIFSYKWRVLSQAVIKTIDVSYGGENGFSQAIELASECLHNVKYFKEKELVSNFFELIAKETGTYCYGIEDTLVCEIARVLCHASELWHIFDAL